MPQVEIVQGDLLDQDVDVIVNAWNRNFIPQWLLIPQGVSRAIRNRAGPQPFKELSHLGMLKLGQAVLTSPGRLPYKAIIHVAGINWHWRSSDRSIRDSTKNAYELAKAKSLSSIAFPLIGAGTGGKNRARVKALMVSVLEPMDGPTACVVEYVK